MNEKTKPEDSAFASMAVMSNGTRWKTDGLTKREYFAAMAMQGVFSSELVAGKPYEDICERAVKAADCLIEALNKQP